MIGIMEYFIGLCIMLVVIGGIMRVLDNKALQLFMNCLLLIMLSSAITTMILQNKSTSYESVLSINTFSLLVMLIFTVAALLLNGIAFENLGYRDFAPISNIILVGAYMVAMASSLIVIFLGMELVTALTLLLILERRNALEGAGKLFVMSAISVTVFSFALVLFFGATGNALLSVHAASDMLYVSVFLLLAAIGVEASIFPLNLWIPDVYESVPAHLEALLGGFNKKVALVALIEIAAISFASYQFSPLLLGGIAVLTMTYGNIMALKQDNMKRLMAYSSISQAGYILIGIATGTAYGLGGSIVQIAAHSIAFIGIVGLLSYFESTNRVNIDQFIGLNSENWFAALSFAILLLSLAGIPFTAGFIGKFMLFSSAVYSNYLILAIFGVLNSIISFYYYSRIIVTMYAKKANAHRARVSWGIVVTALVCIVLTIAIGLYPEAIIAVAKAAGAYMLH